MFLRLELGIQCKYFDVFNAARLEIECRPIERIFLAIECHSSKCLCYMLNFCTRNQRKRFFRPHHVHFIALCLEPV